MEQHNYIHLQALGDSNFQVVNNEPTIIGWKVHSEGGTYLGQIKDLLFDTETMAVRYLVIDLTANGMSLDDKLVMIPIGIANLHTNNDEVVLPNVHMEQFNALPAYVGGQIGPEIEVQIREIIGSPAALRMEEAISAFDQHEFYSHHHFDTDKFYQRNRLSENLTNPEFSGTASVADRETEETTIHKLIENSANHALHAAAQQTGAGTHHNEHQPIQQWKDKQDGNNGNSENPLL